MGSLSLNLSFRRCKLFFKILFQDEIINLVSSLPLTSVKSPSPVPTTDGGEETKEEADGDITASPQTKSPIIATPQEDLPAQEPDAVPLVVPAALFRPTSYHPMHIFVSTHSDETLSLPRVAKLNMR